jgi:hypothetical protein
MILPTSLLTPIYSPRVKIEEEEEEEEEANTPFGTS